jgi:hypothetical protein
MTMAEHAQQPPVLPFEQHANNINACHAAPIDRVRETSIACCKANAAIRSPVTRKRLFALLPFNATTFYQYAKIGADPRLMDPERRHLWPAKMRPMYELHQMSDDELQAFEAAGLWTSGLRQVHIKRWKTSRSGPALSGAFYAALRPKRSLADTEMSRIDAALSEIAEVFEMDVVYPESKTENCNWEKAIDQMRRKAKQVVAEHIKQLKKNGRRALQPELRRYAGFYADEVAIEHDADEERILEVLTTIGREDELEGIRTAAFEEFPIDGPDAPEWMATVADKPPPLEALAADEAEIKAPPITSFGTITEKMKKAFKDFK